MVCHFLEIWISLKNRFPTKVKNEESFVKTSINEERIKKNEERRKNIEESDG